MRFRGSNQRRRNLFPGQILSLCTFFVSDLWFIDFTDFCRTSFFIFLHKHRFTLFNHKLCKLNVRCIFCNYFGSNGATLTHTGPFLGRGFGLVPIITCTWNNRKEYVWLKSQTLFISNLVRQISNVTMERFCHWLTNQCK